MRRVSLFVVVVLVGVVVATGAALGQEAGPEPTEEPQVSQFCITVEMDGAPTSEWDAGGLLEALMAGQVRLVDVRGPEACATDTLTPTPVPTATPNPIPSPGRLEFVGRPSATARVRQGGMLTYEFKVKNAGGQPQGFAVYVSGPSGIARFVDCRPSCVDEDEFFGERSLIFGNLKPGRTQTYKLLYKALRPDHIEWSMCLDVDYEGSCDADLPEWGGSTLIQAPKPKPGFDGDGTYRVGKDIRPGVYRAKAAPNPVLKSCYWARLRNLSGEFGGIIANSNTNGTTTVRILKSDKGFEASGCTRFVRVGS